MRKYDNTSTGVFSFGTVTINGWNCMIVPINTGPFTVSDNNVTLRSADGRVSSRVRYSPGSLYRKATDDYVLAGDLGSGNTNQFGNIIAGTKNYTAIYESDGSIISGQLVQYINPSGNKIGINRGIYPTGTLDLSTSSSSTQGFIVRGSANQSANLVEYKNSANYILFWLCNP